MKNEFEVLNRDLVEARERVRRCDQLRTRLLHIREDLRAERRRLQPLKEAQAQESADVRRLEGFGLTALFHTILGSKDQQLAKERQEALAAKQKHDEAAFAVDALVEEQRRCRKELEPLADAEARYQKLLDSRETLLRRESPDAAARLVEIADRVGENRADLKEIEEAHAAGLRAQASLRVIVDRLGKAESWGAWQGRVSSARKHSNLDEARSHAHVAQRQLRTFGRDLRDIGERLDAGLDGDVTNFADSFINGLIVDWIDHVRIQESLAAATKAEGRVRQLMAGLESRLADARARLA